MIQLKKVISSDEIQHIINEEQELAGKYEDYIPRTELVLLSKKEVDKRQYHNIKRQLKTFEGGDKKFAYHVLYEMLIKSKGSLSLTFQEPMVIGGINNDAVILFDCLFMTDGFEIEATSFTDVCFQFYNFSLYRKEGIEIFEFYTSIGNCGKPEAKIVLKGDDKDLVKECYIKIDSLYNKFMHSIIIDGNEDYTNDFLKSLKI